MSTSKVSLYNEAFLKAVWTSGRFRKFVADLTRFDGTDPLADISASHRWYRRFGRLPSTADLLIILYALDTEMRLGLFVEHKHAGAEWTHRKPRPPELRAIRCSAIQTMVIAPKRLLRKHSQQSSCYDIRLAYEDVSDFVPLFSEEIDETYQDRTPKFPDGGLI